MNMSELPARLFEGVLRIWKRRVIVYAVCAVCFLGIAVESISIGRILLERAFGPIGGRLLISGVLLIVIASALLTLWQMERRARLRTAERAEDGSEDDPRVAMIAQAINLGYTFARGFGPNQADPPDPRDDPSLNEKQRAPQVTE
jgi:hypothetical protein